MREEIDKAQSYINVRTGMLLAMQGTLLAILSGLKPAAPVASLIAVAAILMTAMWLIAHDGYLIDVRILKAQHDEMAPYDPVVRALRSARPFLPGFGATVLVARYLPVFVSVGWFVFLVAIWPFDIPWSNSK